MGFQPLKSRTCRVVLARFERRARVKRGLTAAGIAAGLAIGLGGCAVGGFDFAGVASEPSRVESAVLLTDSQKALRDFAVRTRTAPWSAYEGKSSQAGMMGRVASVLLNGVREDMAPEITFTGTSPAIAAYLRDLYRNAAPETGAPEPATISVADTVAAVGGLVDSLWADTAAAADLSEAVSYVAETVVRTPVAVLAPQRRAGGPRAQSRRNRSTLPVDLELMRESASNLSRQLEGFQEARMAVTPYAPGQDWAAYEAMLSRVELSVQRLEALVDAASPAAT